MNGYQIKNRFFFFFDGFHNPKSFSPKYIGTATGQSPSFAATGSEGTSGGSAGAGTAGSVPGSAGTWLTFVGRLWAQFPGAAEDAADEQDEDGEVTIHVADAPGSERSISPRSMPLM